MTQQTFHLESSMSDRANFDEMAAREARDLFRESDPIERVRRGEIIAADRWTDTRAAILHDIIDVDDMEEAEARYLAAFAKAWDAEREEVENAKPRHITVDADTFLDEEQLCEVCLAVVWLPGIGDDTCIDDNGGGEYVPCPECGSRYYASGDDGRFARETPVPDWDAPDHDVVP